jgi:hypothetical protein
MQVDFNQRWRDRRGSYRPAGEVIETSQYEVARIADDRTARDFVCRHHYSGTYPAARVRFGLYHQAQLVGVAVFSVPVQARALSNIFGGDASNALDLGRFILLDEVPGNGETWFLARCREDLRRDFVGMIAFADDNPRTDAAGRVILAGHIGTIYQASNAVYMGRGEGRTLWLLPDGSILSPRAIQKIRKGERGFLPQVEKLEAFGAPSLDRSTEDREPWLRLALATVARPFKHRGNHKYAWSFDRRMKISAGVTYPKRACAS